jgi:hypothetical protein
MGVTLLMDRIPKIDFSIWSEGLREFALPLIGILRDEKRSRLSEHISLMRQAPKSDNFDEDDVIFDLGMGGVVALLAYGAEGLNALSDLVIINYPRARFTSVAPMALLSIVFNRPDMMKSYIEVLSRYLEEEVSTRLMQDFLSPYENFELKSEAHRQLSRIIHSFASNPLERHRLGDLIGGINWSLSVSERKGLLLPAVNLVIESVVQGTLNISDAICHELEVLIASDLPERVYQEFFEKNPALIDPLSSSIVERQHMGEEWHSDFVIRRLDDQYIFVEIEKPQDSPCTNYPHPSAALSHALGQVLNWFAWVEDNIAYAQSHGFSGIHSPRGIVVIGRNADLKPRQLRLLKALNDNLNPRIRIETYDDVLVNARNIIRNLIAR